MNELRIFETISNETTKNPDGSLFTLSSICEENGEFEIVLFGNGGLETARKAIRRASEVVFNGRGI